MTYNVFSGTLNPTQSITHTHTHSHTHTYHLPNFIGCRSRDEWSSRLRVLYTNRSLQWRRCTCLQTFILPPSMVAISAHLHIDHSLFHGCEPPSVTEVSLSQDRDCGTVCRLLVRQTTSYGHFRRHLKYIYLGPRKPRCTVTFIFFVLHKYTYLLTFVMLMITNSFGFVRRHSSCLQCYLHRLLTVT